ncbi:hypothetical protein [Nostocoides sp. Soil756]|jgi:hypothetical protein|uniref:hypothetical protein n=1 Tax=Nostocoides sp. Soil756 TaxID=1736399 RepID=UPI0006F81165|nr:hypothetical protein [Tetrasphaera sp. Soil756]KRE60124.1 hypothetical protein ASG78_15575 [Tetrasphaera sp. Soil756]
MARAEVEGLSLGYRLGWRFRYIATSVFGPAQLGTAEDPQQKLLRERQRRVERIRAEKVARTDG